eukprot:TRINITY_DN21536_c0_g1_i1.p2 TRINITY_DN21536_c0_g1~~TRINITY_DN21536_c0_g1_i1.p2  ORF type:complete len:112 (-),score=37.82 TRINITY_DN21536_c0_g1_i1:387-722(-)
MCIRDRCWRCWRYPSKKQVRESWTKEQVREGLYGDGHEGRYCENTPSDDNPLCEQEEPVARELSLWAEFVAPVMDMNPEIMPASIHAMDPGASQEGAWVLVEEEEVSADAA